ncbi:hypothetical protein BX661DRAFT_176610 [Kickxella alabastrina]|uniref:uncharacterized protein n=1 Tax=Kickxella alabastrina TaxID=61397 RepID=UPI00221E6715|nr:uncharacterized protein BX661DRAFT_176610 [Kickxella alabastrina]KAI7834082.1 hypothetical protein BX661DRAFT_176610 [Kickxella alabastrina]
MPSRLDTVTGRMSKLMLRRWTMLAERCEIDNCCAPLMRNPETNISKCVWHDAYELFPDEVEHEEEEYEREDEKLDAKASFSGEDLDEPEYELEPDVTTDESSEAKERNERREQRDSVSDKIGQLMLKGWTMLGESCPNSHCLGVPLVRDHDGVQMCVSCGQRSMDEDAYVKKYGALPTDIEMADPISQVAAKHSREPSPEPVTETISTPVASCSFEAPILAVCPPKPVYSSSAGAPEIAIGALNTKLVELSAMLAAATRHKDISHISSAISVCAKALRECQKLR